MRQQLVQVGQEWRHRIRRGHTVRVDHVAPTLTPQAKGPELTVYYWDGHVLRSTSRSRFLCWYRPAGDYRTRHQR